MIVAFDIPERFKKERHWLRGELRGLGFEMLQKSVWFGSAPLPIGFVETLGTLRLLEFIKFFDAKEADIV